MIKENSQDKPSISLHCIDAIELSIFIEKQGLAFYEKTAQTMEDSRVKEMFLHLAKEEKEHIQSLQAKAQYLKPALSKKSTARRNLELFIEEELKERVFPDVKSVGVNQGNPVRTDLEALEIGIASEKRSIRVLTDLLERERKIDVRAIFSHLIAEEKKHLASLEELKKAYLSRKG